MSAQVPTDTATPDQRGGTYERDTTVRAVLRYETDTIHELRRDRKFTTFGSDDDRDIQIVDKDISGHHGRLERRARGIVLVDERSKNGTYYETKRTFGVGLKAHFEEFPVPPDGQYPRPGTTFLVRTRPHRYIAIDEEIQKHHPTLLDLLGTEEEVQRDRGDVQELERLGMEVDDNMQGMPELVSPCDFILAADSGGPLLITGNPRCAPIELAHIAHKISKRRGSEYVERDHLPEDPDERRALVIDEANNATLVLNFLRLEDGDTPEPVDPRLVSSLFWPGYQIRVIVLTRTVEQARSLLGDTYVQPMMRVPLRLPTERRGAIAGIFDRWCARNDSPLRIADLTPENRRRILARRWRSVATLHQTARRLDAVARAPTLNQARVSLGVARSSFYAWFGKSLRLDEPLVDPERAPALLAAFAAQPPRATEDLDFEQTDDSDDDEG